MGLIDSKTPRKPYKNVKSDYIKDKIRQTDFDNIDQRKYINNLIVIEEVILDNIKLNYASGQAYQQIKNKHCYERDQIHKELKPEVYNKKKLEEYRTKIGREKHRKHDAEKDRKSVV